MTMDTKVLAALTKFLGSEEEAIERYDEMVAEQIAADIKRAANKYQNERRNVYPDIGDQLDDLFHAGAFSDDMAAKIQAVKDAHPKPEE